MIKRGTETDETLFKNFRDNLIKLHNCLLVAYISFLIWESFQELKAPNCVGEKTAMGNLVLMKKYEKFFEPTIRAHSHIFIVELAKIFDTNRDAICVKKVKNRAQSERMFLQAGNFIAANSDRDFIESLAENYEGIAEKDLQEIEKILEESAVLIEKVRVIRHSLVHCFPNSKNEKPPISVKEVLKLFRIAEKILNKLLDKLNFETMWHFHEFDSNLTKGQTKAVVINLKKFESHRLAKIKKS